MEKENKYKKYNFRKSVLKDKKYIVKNKIHCIVEDIIPNYNFTCLCSMSSKAFCFDKPTLLIHINKKYDAKKYSIADLFNHIELEIGGSRMEKHWSYQIEIMMKLYNLKSIYTTNLITFPIPFDLFLGKNIFRKESCLYHEVRILFQTKYDFPIDLVDKIELQCEELHFENNEKICCTTVHDHCNICVPDCDLTLHPIYFCGEENINNLTDFNLYFNHDTLVLFFYFTDQNYKLIKDDIFENVKLLLTPINSTKEKIYKDYDLDTILIDSFNYTGEINKGIYFMPLAYDKIDASTINKIQNNDEVAINLSKMDITKVRFKWNTKYNLNEVHLNIFSICRIECGYVGGLFGRYSGW